MHFGEDLNELLSWSPLQVPQDPYDEPSQLIQGRDSNISVEVFGLNADQKYVFMSAQERIQSVATGFQPKTSLDTPPNICFSYIYRPITTHTVFIRQFQAKVDGERPEWTASDFAERSGEYFNRMSQQASLGDMSGTQILDFLYLLKVHALYGISLHPDTWFLNESRKVENKDGRACSYYMPAPEIPPIFPSRMYSISSSQYSVYVSGIHESFSVDPLRPFSADDLHKSNNWGIPFLGFVPAYNNQYIHFIKTVWAEEVCGRAFNLFNEMVRKSKSTDLETLKKLRSELTNRMGNIDNAICARIPVTAVDDSGNKLFDYYLGIPGAIPDPSNNYELFYPRQELSRIYENEMQLALNHLNTTIGKRTEEAKGIGKPPDLGTPETNPHLVLDVEASIRQGRLVYRDTSKNQNVSYIQNRTYITGGADDLRAVLKAYETAKDYMRYPTGGGITISTEDQKGMGLITENPFKKFLPLTIMAALVGYGIATG